MYQTDVKAFVRRNRQTAAGRAYLQALYQEIDRVVKEHERNNQELCQQHVEDAVLESGVILRRGQRRQKKHARHSFSRA